MNFNKSFPRKVEGSNYPVWVDVYLTEEEEKEAEDIARKENFKILAQSIKDAEVMFQKLNLENNQHDLIEVAKSLFEKRASHEVFWKEAKTKEKFDKSEQR